MHDVYNVLFVQEKSVQMQHIRSMDGAAESCHFKEKDLTFYREMYLFVISGIIKLSRDQ